MLKEQGQAAGELGKKGEDVAAKYLNDKGFKVLALNARFRTGEIDIVASKKGELHFVEVKSRKSVVFAAPSEFVTRSKINKILSAAQIFLSSDETGKKFRSAPCHFDVISVNYSKSPPAIEFIPDAFEADER